MTLILDERNTLDSIADGKPVVCSLCAQLYLSSPQTREWALALRASGFEHKHPCVMVCQTCRDNMLEIANGEAN